MVMGASHVQWFATALILLSALLHAAANTLVKISGDGLITRGCMNAIACVIAMPLLLVVPPPDADLRRLLALSVLVHALYPFFLVEAYRHGDLSTAFPLVRGSVPLLVTLIAALALGQYPGPVTLCGIVLLSAAVASLAQFTGLQSVRSHWHGTAYALLTGLTVAAYTVVDAAGLRAAPTALAYMVWLFVLDGACVAAAVAVARGRAIAPFVRRHWRASLAAGFLGVLTYGLALFAFSLGPVAEIAALRETSIFFAALIGALFLKEPYGKSRITSALVAVAGIIIIHAGR
jgi:drug/metabolite transporter (DMT)-like permease